MTIYLMTHAQCEQNVANDPGRADFLINPATGSDDDINDGSNTNYIGRGGCLCRQHNYLTMLLSLPRFDNWRDSLQEIGQQFVFSRYNEISRYVDMREIKHKLDKPAQFLEYMNQALAHDYDYKQAYIFQVDALSETAQLLQQNDGKLQNKTERELCTEVFDTNGGNPSRARKKLNELLIANIGEIRADALSERKQKLGSHFKSFKLWSCCKDIIKLCGIHLNARSLISSCNYYCNDKNPVNIGGRGFGYDTTRSRISDDEHLWED